MAPHKVIVFGPTGAVGSAAALTAQELGAQVILAMRNTSKPIPGLDASTEKNGNFERTEADLTKPDTVRDAVTKTGAKHAFIYLAHSSPDHMRATIQALKAGGVELVVFLSSFTIDGEPRSVPRDEIIPWFHAQVEINLSEVFGAGGFVAARGGSFASNMVQYKSGFEAGVVKVFSPDTKVDNIAPGDIGRVCGTVLAKGPQDDARVIYCYGPELMSQRESVQVISKVLGKTPEIKISSQEDAYKMFTEERGVPAPVAKWMTSAALRADGETGSLQVYGRAVTEEQLRNVEKYSGRKGTRFEEWVVQNKGLFVS